LFSRLAVAEPCFKNKTAELLKMIENGHGPFADKKGFELDVAERIKEDFGGELVEQTNTSGYGVILDSRLHSIYPRQSEKGLKGAFKEPVIFDSLLIKQAADMLRRLESSPQLHPHLISPTGDAPLIVRGGLYEIYIPPRILEEEAEEYEGFVKT
jgi:hypothetical protein